LAVSQTKQTKERKPPVIDSMVSRKRNTTQKENKKPKVRYMNRKAMNGKVGTKLSGFFFLGFSCLFCGFLLITSSALFIETGKPQ